MPADEQTPDPAEALAAIARSRRDVQRRVGAGSWRYDLIYSAIVAGMVGSQGLDMPLSAVGVALGVCALAVLFRREADRLGVSVTGMTPRRARWVAIGLGMLMVALIVGAILLKHLAPSGLVFAVGLAGLIGLTFVLSLAASRLWLRVYRRETWAGE